MVRLDGMLARVSPRGFEVLKFQESSIQVSQSVTMPTRADNRNTRGVMRPTR
jgi:hypothetical protein